MAARQRYIYMRTRRDGKSNQSTSLKSFEKWLKEVDEGDEFFVAKCEWVQCDLDKLAPSGVAEYLRTRFIEELPEGTATIPHVTKVADAETVDNGPQAK